MSEALRIRSGAFGRVALLDMDRSLVRHAHPHCHVLLKVEGADTCFEVGDRVAHLTDESAVLVDAWRPHAYVHREGAPRTVILALYIEPAWLGEFRANWRASGGSGFFRTSNGAMTPGIRRLARRLADSMIDTPGALDDHEAMLARLMIAVIERFCEWRQVASDMSGRARLSGVDFRVGKAMNLMQARPGTPMKMAALARESGMSRANFFRLFEKEIGIAPGMYLNVVRLEHAIERAVCSDMSFANVADDLGFSSPGHFTRFFAGHAGVPPSRFRQVARLAGT